MVHLAARSGQPEVQPDRRGRVGYFQYLAINSAFVRFQSAALNSFAESIRDAQLTGTLEIVLATPTRLTTLVLSSAVWSFTLTAMQTAVFLAIAVMFGLDLSHVDFLTTAVFLVLTVAAVSPLGVLAAALSMVIKKTGPIEWLSTSSAALFGGVYLPLRSLPYVAAGHRLDACPSPTRSTVSAPRPPAFRCAPPRPTRSGCSSRR